MTTELTKSVTRFSRRDQLVVTMTPEGITIREPRRRFTYGPVPYYLIKLMAARQMAEEARREKEARKQERATLRRVKRGAI